ncbi:hypothetical protein MMC11_002942 [Xylographa trunciseda]|nr:hypothetical protein [Xylographa trunciseda]
MTGISDERVEMQGRPREIDIEASLGSTAIEYNTSQQQVTLRATRSEPARETQKEEVHVLQSPINLGLAFYTDFRASHVKEGKPAQCVFICWGDTLVKQMIDVPVTYKDSDKNVYKKMRKSWFAVRGRWRRYFPLYDVKCVREVKFRFLRRREHHFEVLVKDTLDRVEHLRTLQEAQAAAKRLAPDPMAEPTCYFDSECQKYVHEYDRCCEYTDENDFEHPNRLNFCPQRDLDYAQRVLASFEMQPLLTLCFHDPEYAVEHSTLRRVSDDVYEDSYENSCILNYE